MKQTKNLSDNRYGKLSVLSRSELASKADYSNSAEKSRCRTNRYVDISGKQVGYITVLEPTERRDYKGSVIWKCKCQCGNIFYASEDSLLHGKRRSCGCFKEEWTANFSQDSFLTFVDGTCVEWLKNRKSRSDNTSGFRGINVSKNGKYRVTIGFRQKRYYLGSFSSFDEAVNVRLKAEQVLHVGFVDSYEAWANKASADPDWALDNPFSFHIDSNDIKALAVRQRSH